MPFRLAHAGDFHLEAELAPLTAARSPADEFRAYSG